MEGLVGELNEVSAPTLLCRRNFGSCSLDRHCRGGALQIYDTVFGTLKKLSCAGILIFILGMLLQVAGPIMPITGIDIFSVFKSTPTCGPTRRPTSRPSSSYSYSSYSSRSRTPSPTPCPTPYSSDGFMTGFFVGYAAPRLRYDRLPCPCAARATARCTVRETRSRAVRQASLFIHFHACV